MTNKDRKHYITHIALAVQNLVYEPWVERKRIGDFADAIINLAEKSDEWVTNHQKQFDDILHDAKEINNRR